MTTYPVGSLITWHFPKRGDMTPVKLVWYDGGLRPDRPAGLGETVEMVFASKLREVEALLAAREEALQTERLFRGR